MTWGKARGAVAWLVRHPAAIVLALTPGGLATGLVLYAAGSGRGADGAWPTAGLLGAGYALWADLADLRALLYGLHAILRLHTAQEDESYLSLGDGDLTPARPPGPAG